MYDDGKWTGWTTFKNMVAAKMQPEEDKSMTAEERKEMDNLKRQVREQSTIIDAQSKALAAATTRIPAQEWFVQEFGSDDLGGLLNEPTMTKEGWRNTAIALRTQGFGNGRGKCVDIK